MTNFEALKKLSRNDLSLVLDQIFVTGFNAGYQSVVDETVDDTNPYMSAWLDDEAEAAVLKPVTDDGEDYLILTGLRELVEKMAQFDVDDMGCKVEWQRQIIMPR